MDERTDQQLVKACLEGDRNAFAVLVRRYQDSVFGLAVGMTRNHEDAADMAQEAFIRAYAKLGQYKPEYEFRTWVLRICANQTKNLFRKRVRRRKAEEEHLKQEAVAEHEDGTDFSEVENALAALPPKLAAPLRLKYMEGLAYEDISKILGIGVSAAKMRVLRARKLMAEVMDHA